MSDSLEMDKCDFCQEIKQVERTYLHPSKYVKEQGAFINKTLYNEGDYFIIVKTCIDCGTPTSSQTEISNSTITDQIDGIIFEIPFDDKLKLWELIDELIEENITKISDEEIEKAFIDASERLSEYKEGLIDGAKWYREQLKQKLYGSNN